MAQMYEFRELSVVIWAPMPSWMARRVEAEHRRRNDRMRQGLLNNLWDVNPGELDRWADDGGR